MEKKPQKSEIKAWTDKTGLCAGLIENYIGGHDSFNVKVVDDESLAILRRIKALMEENFVGYGDDGNRYMWIVVNELDEDYPDTESWFKIATGQYQDLETIWISDKRWNATSFGNIRSVHEDRSKYHESWMLDAREMLLGIETYVKAVIEAGVDAYNAFVEEYLPYEQRTGIISRKELNEITGGYYDRLELGDDKDKVLAMLEETKDVRPCGIETMTMRKYAELWMLGYRAFSRLTEENGRYVPKEDEDPLTVFKRHSSEGYKLLGDDNGGYDADSEQDFVRWMHDSSPYHSMDICYARIHLFPERMEDGKWSLTLSAHAYGWLGDEVRIALAYQEAGIPIHVEPHDKLLAIINETDKVEVSSCPGKYIGYGEVTNDTSLPYVGEDDGCVSQEVYDRLVAAVKWEKEGTLEALILLPASKSHLNNGAGSGLA